MAGVANARAVPKPITRRKIGSVDVGSVLAYTVRPTTTSASQVRATAAMRRRSTRSAIVPVTKTRIAAGANSASPSSPSASSLPVMSNTCLPSTVLRRAIAVDAANTDESRATTERVSPGAPSSCTSATYRRAVPCLR